MNGLAYKKALVGTKKVSGKGILISVVAGVIMAFFYRFVAASMDMENFASPAPGKLTPYTAVFVFAIGVFVSNFLFNTLAMKHPVEGKPVSISGYFKGDMSLIGPRPLLVSYLPYYTEEERLRHTVRPGLTGLAQVRGRNLLDWDTRFATDVEYVRNLTFMLDVKIFFLTIKKVFVHEDIVVDTNQAEGNFAEIRKAKQKAEAEKREVET